MLTTPLKCVDCGIESMTLFDFDAGTFTTPMGRVLGELPRCFTDKQIKTARGKYGFKINTKE
jgi:hypothetical protein